MNSIAKYIGLKVSAPFAVATIIGLLLLGGVVMAVNIVQTDQTLEGARATTSDIATVTTTHVGATVATTAEAGATDSTIAPSTTTATVIKRAQTVTAGHFVYKVKFESTNTADNIPAGKISSRWTTGGAEQTASLTVSAATVASGNKGGFTLLIPGDVDDTPENIQLLYTAD